MPAARGAERTAALALAVALVLGAPGAVSSGEWVPMSGAQIAEALTGRELVYDSGAWQRFGTSGKTLYHAGQDSWGNWRVEGDRYCSQWPPSDLWACYDMKRYGPRQFRFIGASGEVTDARYRD